MSEEQAPEPEPVEPPAEGIWLEVGEDGTIFQQTAGTKPSPFRGGIIVEIPAMANIGQSIYVDGAVLDIGPRPDFRHFIDPVARTWAVPGLTALEAAREKTWETIKAKRDAEETKLLVTPHGTFQADVKGRKNIESAVSMLRAKQELGMEATIDFTLADDTSVNLGYEQMLTVGLLLGQQIDSAHQISRNLRILKDAAQTVEELALVVWPETEEI